MPDFKIDRKNKTFVFDDGEVLPIPEKDQREVLRTATGNKAKKERKEELKKRKEFGGSFNAFNEKFKNSMLGNLGGQAYDYISSGVSALTPKEGQEDLNYVDRIIDTFYGKLDAEKENLQELGQEYPVASTLGTGAGIAGEVAALGTLPAVAQMPIVGAAHSNTSFLEPWEKAKELGKDVATGYALDKFFNSLSKVAGARGEQRAAKGAIADAEAANAAEAARFAEQTAAREANIANMPRMQQAENAAWAESTAGRVDKTAKAMGSTPVDAGILGVEEFVENNIGRSAHAASAEGNRVAKFLQSVFKPDKAGKISPSTISNGMKSLDQAIISADGASKQLLTEFRDGLIKTLPESYANSYVYEKWANKLLNGALKGTEGAIEKQMANSPKIFEFFSKKLGKKFPGEFDKSISNSVESILSKHKNNLYSALESGQIQLEIRDAVLNNPIYKKVKNQYELLMNSSERGLSYQHYNELKELKSYIESLPETIFERASKIIDKDIVAIKSDYLTKTGNIGRNTSKLNPVPAPLPEPPPVSPINITQVPTMPEPTNLYQRIGRGLENLNFGQTMRGMRRNAPAGALAGMAGIPVAKAAAAGLGLSKGAEILTRPGAIPNAVRATFKQGGIEAIESWAQKYPSYNNGVLENPMERRSLTKEIENDQDMPIEVKAMMQSKVNRGKPLSSFL